MESIISFLESSEHCWKMNPDHSNDFIYIAKKYGYKFGPSKTDSEVKKFLEDKINECLHGEAISEIQFEKIQNHFALTYYTSNKQSGKDAYSFVGSIRYITNQLVSYNDCLTSWLQAKNYIEAYLSLSNQNTDSYESLMADKKIISNSIIQLKSKGYKITIESGEIIICPKSEKRLFEAIRYRFNKIGHYGLFMLLTCISPSYSTESKRFYLRPEPSLSIEGQAHVPWGYLFNVCLANLHETKHDRKNHKLFNECIELTKHYFCIHRIQSFNKYGDMNHRHDTILPAIQNNILYDQHFSIDQISSKHITDIFSGIFTSTHFSSTEIDFIIFSDILKWASNNSKHNQPLAFKVIDVFHGLELRYDYGAIESAVNTLSFEIDELNNGYITPSEITKRNYFERPFVLSGDKYIYVNPNLCNYGFYATALRLCSEKGIDGNVLGKVTEEYVESMFRSKNINFIANKEYIIPKSIAKELKVRSEKGECDFIIETTNRIIFIELKRKTLTSASRTGNTFQSVIDISQSFFHALSQTGKHEYLLRRQGEINFTDGSRITLNSREVERVSLTLFGFFSIQDGSFAHQILRSLINADLSGGNTQDNEKLNKYILELRHQYETDIFQEVYWKQANPFFNCRFFSVPQFLEILSNSSNNEEFEKELNQTRHISTGSKDWFKDYNYKRSLEARVSIQTKAV